MSDKRPKSAHSLTKEQQAERRQLRRRELNIKKYHYARLNHEEGAAASSSSVGHLHLPTYPAMIGNSVAGSGLSSAKPDMDVLLSGGEAFDEGLLPVPDTDDSARLPQNAGPPLQTPATSQHEHAPSNQLAETQLIPIHQPLAAIPPEHSSGGCLPHQRISSLSNNQQASFCRAIAPAPTQPPNPISPNDYDLPLDPTPPFRQVNTVLAQEVQPGDILRNGDPIYEGCKVTNVTFDEVGDLMRLTVRLTGPVRIQWETFSQGKVVLRSMVFEGLEILWIERRAWALRLS